MKKQRLHDAVRNHAPYFSLVSDEPQRTGLSDFGRGTHYIVLQAVSWHLSNLERASMALIHRFAVVLDEDHDLRVMDFLNEVYLAGLLPPILCVGERKGTVYQVLSWPSIDESQATDYKERVSGLAANLDGDSWSVETGVAGYRVPRIVAAETDAISTFIQSITDKWSLGLAPYAALLKDV